MCKAQSHHETMWTTEACRLDRRSSVVEVQVGPPSQETTRGAITQLKKLGGRTTTCPLLEQEAWLVSARPDAQQDECMCLDGVEAGASMARLDNDASDVLRRLHVCAGQSHGHDERRAYCGIVGARKTRRFKTLAQTQGSSFGLSRWDTREMKFGVAPRRTCVLDKDDDGWWCVSAIG